MNAPQLTRETQAQPWLPLDGNLVDLGEAAPARVSREGAPPKAYREALRAWQRLRDLLPHHVRLFVASAAAVRAGLAAHVRQVTIANDLKLSKDRVSRYAAILGIVDRQHPALRESVFRLGYGRLAVLVPLAADVQETLLAELLSAPLPVRELRRRAEGLTTLKGPGREAPGRRPHRRLTLDRASLTRLMADAADLADCIAFGQVTARGTYRVRITATLTFAARPDKFEAEL